MHLIRRQILDLELPRQEGAAKLAQQLGQLFEEKVLPELDQLFSQIIPDGRVLRIQRLEIDLDRISERGMEQFFVEQCVKKIGDQLTQHAFEVQRHSSDQEVLNIRQSEDVLFVVKHFLARGTLPWFAKHTPLDVIDEELIKLLATQPSQVMATLRPVLRSSHRAIHRLIWQFSFTTSSIIVERFLELPKGVIEQVWAVLQEWSVEDLTRFQRDTFLMALYQSPQRSMVKDIADLPKLRRWLNDSGLNKALALPAAHYPSLDKELEKEKELALEDSVGEPKPDPEASDQTTVKEGSLEPTQAEGAGIQQIDPVPYTSKTGKDLSIQEAAFELKGEPIEGAGLVLLAPYLSPFLKKLSLIPQKGDPASAYRAVHLLHFLAFGDQLAEEPFLAIPKILCGLTLAEPVPLVLQQGLTEAEKQEGLNLLKAIIHNWAALKRTKPDGLREGFLQRSGLLSWQEADHRWHLKVERKGRDVLLDEIPWSYSVVKMSWADWFIVVDW